MKMVLCTVTLRVGLFGCNITLNVIFILLLHIRVYAEPIFVPVCACCTGNDVGSFLHASCILLYYTWLYKFIHVAPFNVWGSKVQEYTSVCSGLGISDKIYSWGFQNEKLRIFLGLSRFHIYLICSWKILIGVNLYNKNHIKVCWNSISN